MKDFSMLDRIWVPRAVPSYIWRTKVFQMRNEGHTEGMPLFLSDIEVRREK